MPAMVGVVAQKRMVMVKVDVGEEGWREERTLAVALLCWVCRRDR